MPTSGVGPTSIEVEVRNIVLQVSAELDEVRPNAAFARQRLDEILEEVRKCSCCS